MFKTKSKSYENKKNQTIFPYQKPGVRKWYKMADWEKPTSQPTSV